MGVDLRLSIMALGLAATAAVAQSPHRVVIVVAHAGDPRAKQQHLELEHRGSALRERDVVVQDMTPEAARRERPELGVCSQVTFEVLLVGKDGGIKLRRQNSVSAFEIETLIDGMPMRRNEMKR